MAEANDTAAVQDNTTETVAETVADTKVEAKTEETVGDALSPESKKEAKMVPEAVFLELKKSNKELAKQMKDLQKSIEDGATKGEISTDLKALAEEHNVDADFLKKFAEAVKAQSSQEIDDKVSAKLKPLEEKERQIKINTIFEEKFAQAIEAMPEYKDVVNKDVIKSLSLDPNYQSKTWKQIIEGAYGHLIAGKKTMESSTARGGRDDNQEVDFGRAAKDTKYFSEIMANPELKKKYNTGLAERLKI